MYIYIHIRLCLFVDTCIRSKPTLCISLSLSLSPSLSLSLYIYIHTYIYIYSTHLSQTHTPNWLSFTHTHTHSPSLSLSFSRSLSLSLSLGVERFRAEENRHILLPTNAPLESHRNQTPHHTTEITRVGGDGLYRRGVATSQKTKDCDTALLNTFISMKTEILKVRVVGLEERVIGTRGESVSES